MTTGRTNYRAFAATPLEHVRLVHVDCRRPHCPICDGGLFVCTVCGQAEGELQPVCPGPQPNPPPPPHARFITRSETPAELDVAFELAMRGRLFGREETQDALLWFSLGWIALQRLNAGLPYLVGPDDTQREVKR